MEKIKEKIKEKEACRKIVEDRVISYIRNGKELARRDLDTIFALSSAICALEELLQN
jgi:hypothetical protein